MKIKKTFTGATAVLSLGMLASSAHAVTLYQDNFDGLATVDLGSTIPDISATGDGWITAFSRANGGSDNGAAQVFNGDGSVIKNGGNATHDAGALLPFTIEAGLIYTLEATFTNNNASWIAVGFASGNAQLDGSNGRHSATSVANFGGYAWALSRNNTGTDQEIFNGIGTGSAVLGGDFVDPTAAITFTINLNTTDTAAITADYFFNGVQQGGTQTLEAAAFGNIDFVGFSSDGSTGDGNAQLSSFTFSSVPEPSSAMLVALSSLGLLARRRKG